MSVLVLGLHLYQIHIYSFLLAPKRRGAKVGMEVIKNKNKIIFFYYAVISFVLYSMPVYMSMVRLGM